MTDKLKIRDFIYLDVERMKSIFSQIYEGVTESSIEEKGNQKKFDAKGAGSGGFPGFAKIKGEIEGGIIWENKQTETKTLHDYMYNIIERVLKDKNSIYQINVNNKEIKKSWENGNLSNNIPDNSFVLIKGRVMIDDYEKFGQIANNFNDLSSIMSGQSSDMNMNQIEGIKLIMQLFYQNELFVKVLPYSENQYLRFIGNLNRNFLRDSIESITFKYGTFPVSEWYVFGQISSIFPKDHDPLNMRDDGYDQKIKNAGRINTILTKIDALGIKIHSNFDLDKLDITDPKYSTITIEEIEFLKKLHLNKFDFDVLRKVGFDTVFESIFNGFREIDYSLSTKFPSITFTPIAVYRGD